MKISCFIFSILLLAGLLAGQTKKIVLNDPYEVFPLYYKAIESAASNKFDLAQAQLQTVVSMVPYYHSATVFLALCDDIIDGKYPKRSGLSIFNAIYNLQNGNDTLWVINTISHQIESHGNYPYLYFIRGTIYNDLEDYPAAISDLSKVIEINPGFVTGWFFRGKVYLTIGNSEQALEDFNAALYRDPNFVPALVSTGKIQYDNKNIEKAYKYLSQAMTLNPSYSKEFKLVEIFNAAGIHYLDKNNNPAALEALNCALSIGTDWSEPFLNRGIAYKNLNEYLPAISDFDRSIALDSALAAAYYQRGLCFLELKNLNQAENDLVRSTELDTGNLQYLNSLGKFYFDQRQDEKAISVFMRVLQFDEADIWANYWIAFSYDRQKDYRNAINYYRQFILSVPNEYKNYKMRAQRRMKKIGRWLKSQSDL